MVARNALHEIARLYGGCRGSCKLFDGEWMRITIESRIRKVLLLWTNNWIGRQTLGLNLSKKRE